MKRVYVTTALTCLVILIAVIGGLRLLNLSGGRENLTVGFVYDNDESTPYTYNFMRAQKAVAAQYGERVQISVKSNTSEEDGEAAINELALVKDDQDLDALLARYDVDLADEDREKLVRGIKIKKKRETHI